MHLLSSLNSGLAAAANGTAEIYIRGSSTRATTYPDFEASSSNSSGADITLDAYGSALVYVNQLVDVVVKDADGNTVRSYGDGYASPNIEVISPAFTGIDYVTAASAVSEPTTLQAVLDLWATNAGAPDWKVEINGADTTLLNAFGSLSGLIYNVKNPAYGAVGDGVTNDQTAIAAAHAAAVAAGGGIVFFPKGTYLITTAIVWSPLVSIVGVGMDLSIITMNAAAEKTLRFTAANTSGTPTLVYGMGFQTAQANSTTTIELTTAGAFVEFNHCSFAKTSTSTGLAITVGHADVRLRCIECHFPFRSATVGVYSCAVLADSVLFERCRATAQTSATFDGDVFLTAGTTEFRDCWIDYSATSPTGTSRMIDMNSGSDSLTVTGCKFIGGAGTTTAIDLVDAGFCIAKDNTFDNLTNKYVLASGVLENGSFVETLGYHRNESASTAVTINNGISLFIFQSSGTVPTITMPSKYFIGQRISSIIMNDSGVAWGTDIIFSGDQVWGPTVVNLAVADGDAAFCDWVVANLDAVGTLYWVATAMKRGSV